MTLDPIPTLIVERKPYTLQPGDRVIYDSRNGTLFVHNEDDDDVYFRVGDHVVSRHFIGNLAKPEAQSAVTDLVRASRPAAEVKEVEGSFPTLITFVVVS
jgi:hypothetical protein